MVIPTWIAFSSEGASRVGSGIPGSGGGIVPNRCSFPVRPIPASIPNGRPGEWFRLSPSGYRAMLAWRTLCTFTGNTASRINRRGFSFGSMRLPLNPGWTAL